MHWHTFPAQGGTRARTPAASLIGLVCLIAGGLQAACAWIPHGGSAAGSFLGEAFALNGQKLAEGQWWSLLGFSFAHTGFWHWAVGALGFYVVSRSVEPIIGGWHLLGVTLLGNIFSGAVHCLASLWGALPPGQPLMGMLPALFTLVGVYATVLPGWRLGAASRWRGARWCATRLHAPRARHTAWIAAAGAALWWAADWRSECGPGALLPALCTGWAYTRMLGFGDRLFFRRLMEDGASRSGAWNS
jgi:membrane associated rhomboid family serine protease